MALPVSFYSSTIADETVKANGEPEVTTWSVPVTTLTAANYVAKKALIDALQTAVNDVVLGVLRNTDVTIDRELVSILPSNNPLAQRENKWLARYHDSVTQLRFQVSIGTANLSLKIAHSENLDLTAGVGLALKTAFELIVVSPDDSAHSVVLDSVKFVGRNT